MKFDRALIARIDARARVLGIDRTAFFTRAAEAALDIPKPKPASRPKKPDTSPSTTLQMQPYRIENAREMAAIGGSIIRKRVPRQPGEVRVSDAPIAGWGENRPAPGSMLKQPKKGKGQ